MSIRLEDLITDGALTHIPPMTVRGEIYLRGRERPLLIELTGIPSEELVDRSFEFNIPENDRPPTDEDRKQAQLLQVQQIGVVGVLTMAQPLRTFAGPASEFYQRCSLGQPPPSTWQYSLFVEWFSQNGRVTFQLPNSTLEFIDDLPAPVLPPLVPPSYPPLADEEPQNSWDPDQTQSFGLPLEELEHQLQLNAQEIETALAKYPSPEARMLREFEQIEACLEASSEPCEDSPLKELFSMFELPDADDNLSDGQALNAIKAALAPLALFGINYEVCEHCSVQDAYRYLAQYVIPSCTKYPEMRGSSYINTYSTYNYCEKCMEEFTG